MAVIDTSIKKESRDRYLTYALSVVSGRALPDVRDGLKPVQRRILYAMAENLNLKPSGSHKKSAAVVGEVLARYHPHGDSACYEAMVRMAQDFSLRYPLVDGQGNFGSLDGDSAAAYRYTEAKLRPLAMEVLGEIREDTVIFRDNFDASTQEPMVLPSRVPNLLVNGATGIAVGMATSIPPHNLSEVIKALLEYSKDPEITAARLSAIVKGPDFPTGCQILNSKKSLTQIYKTGRGVVRMRGEWKEEVDKKGKRSLIITSIPYMQNKSQLVEKIANLIIDKKVPQLTDVRDESTEDVRVVLELQQDADAEMVMAYVFKNTPLEGNFPVNLTALVPTDTGSLRPQLLSLKEMLQHFLDFREQVVVNRLKFERKNLKERIHILEGFVSIFDSLDEAIEIVRRSLGRSDAAKKLRARFDLTEIQSFAVVDLRIYQLSRTNIKEIKAELKEKLARVQEIEAILRSRTKVVNLVRADLKQIDKDFGDKRICRVIKDHVDQEIDESEFIVEEEVHAIVTVDGWVKRIRQTNDAAGTRVREGDRILRAHPLTTKDSVAIITNLGYLYSIKVKDMPSSSGYGSPIQKLLKFRDGEKIVDSFAVCIGADEFIDGYPYCLHDGSQMLLLSAKGVGYGFEFSGLEGLKRNGKRIMKFRGDDTLAAICPIDKKMSLFTKKGSGLTVSLKDVPVRDSAAVGVSLLSVRDLDEVVGCGSFAGRAGAEVHLRLDNGKFKAFNLSEVTTGRRGLKGTKVISRGEILSVERGELYGE